MMSVENFPRPASRGMRQALRISTTTIRAGSPGTSKVATQKPSPGGGWLRFTFGVSSRSFRTVTVASSVFLDCGCGSRGLRTCRRDRPTAFGAALAGLDIAHRPRPYGQDGAHANALPDHLGWSRQLTATPLAAALSSVRVLTPTSLNGSRWSDSQAAITGCWQRKSRSQRKTPLGCEGRWVGVRVVGYQLYRAFIEGSRLSRKGPMMVSE